MEKKEALFSNFRVPEKMVSVVTLQDYLNNLKQTNIDELVNFISKSFISAQYEEVILNIIHFAEIRSKFVQIYAMLCSMLIKILDETFKKILYRMSKGIFLRYLYIENVFTIEEIQEKCNHDFTQYFYFAPELDVPKQCEENRSFGPIYTRLYELRRDNWLLYKDLLELGFDRGTLRFALKFDDIELLKSLSSDPTFTLSKKVFPSPFENSYPMSMLAFSARYGSEHCFTWLLEKGHPFDSEVPENIIIGGNMKLFKILTEKKTVFKRELLTAAKYHRMEIADWLLVNSDNSDVFIDGLIETGNYRIILYFVTPADMTGPQIGTWTPISRAASKGLLSLCIYFMYLGAQINPRRRDSHTALHAAASGGFLEVCRLMVQNGAIIDARDDSGNTPLFLASQKNCLEVVQYLLSNRASVNAQNEDHRTALIAAADSGANEVLKFLLDSGANPNITDDSKRTAVHYAVENKNAEATLQLVRHGADTSLRDDEGVDAWDLCDSRQVRQALNGQEPTPGGGWFGFLSYCRIF